MCSCVYVMLIGIARICIITTANLLDELYNFSGTVVCHIYSYILRCITFFVADEI